MCTLAVLLAVALQVCAPQQAKLVSSDGQPGDRFGHSVDARNGRIAIGAPANRPLAVGTQTGSVYVFEHASGAWQQVAQLTPSNAVPKGEFGYAVACDAERIAVGAPTVLPTSVPGGRGLAYVCSKLGSAWIEEALLDPADASAVSFGSAVDIEGATLLVGAESGGQDGAAFVHVRSGSAWNQQAKLQASDASLGSGFGCTVALEGDIACVGAFAANGVQPAAGAVYVFRRTGGAWSEIQKVTASSGKSHDRFGFALATDGSTLVCGAPLAEIPSHWYWKDHGSAYLFEWNGQQWVEKQEIVPVSYIGSGHFGWAAAVDGSALVLGAPSEILTAGYAHVCVKAAATWFQHVKVTFAPWGAPVQGRLGAALAIEGGRLVAGAPLAHGAAAQEAGAVFVFDLQVQAPAPTYNCTAKPDSKGCTPRFFHAGLPSVTAAAGGIPYKVQCIDFAANTPGMLFYTTSGAARAPFAGGFFCLQQPVRSTQYVQSGTAGGPYPCHGSFSFDFNAWIASGSDPSLTAGQGVWMQYWYRDPAGPPGASIGLSDGIHVVICP